MSTDIPELGDPAVSTPALLDDLRDVLCEIDDANQARSWRTDVRKLSVLIPIYNERWTLAPLMKRVLENSIDVELEIVAVDDGSTDGSAELLRSLATIDSRVHAVFHEKNRGKGGGV